MPPSQLKRLKSSLREQGVTGPQKSKKQKKASKGSQSTSDRIQRNAALQGIRDSFNPFEFKAPSRPAKFQHANSEPAANGKTGRYRDVLQRPGASKSAGEEMRKATLLPEMQKRNKVGGLVDRRIGEGDPGMTAEERAVQRFAQEKQRKKGASLFDLEASDDDEPQVGLTHGGKSLDELGADDFGENLSGGHSDGDEDFMRKKRSYSDVEEDGYAESGDEQEDQPERKKSKKEVMDEVIAKSKLHKHERQKAKEDDDDLRDELDKGLDDMMALLRGQKAPPKPKEPAPESNGDGPQMNPERLKLLNAMDRAQVNKEYDTRIRQLAQEHKAKPSERTKTDEEKIKEEAERLKELEERRAKRMRGEQVSDDDQGESERADNHAALDGDDTIADEAAEFGFTSSNAQPKQPKEKEQLVLEDEDEFALDEDLIASASEIDSDVSGEEEESDVEDDGHADEEDEFVKDILGDMSGSSPAKVNGQTTAPTSTSGLAYTYPCPRSHQEFLDVLKDVADDQIPTIIQRIRALHHPSLSADNKEAMADFSTALVDHLSYMGVQKQSLPIAEQVIRHLHSLSRTYPETIANAFRKHLHATERSLHAGDFVIFTAIGSVYPTSDHFHQVVTPAITLMARWLGMNVLPDTAQKHATGAFLVSMCLNYQKLSKRYIPEAVRFTLRALASPSKSQKAHLANFLTMLDLWKDKSAFIEIFTPALPILQKLPNTKRELQALRIHLTQARTRRRPLELHHHRPLAVRNAIPKFEEGFNPDKHYDPDKERSDAKKLQKEYKRERKGALRELRKDANFVARQQLREKRERDAEYEKKYRRLVAEVQGEEGREAKGYQREKEARKRKA